MNTNPSSLSRGIWRARGGDEELIAVDSEAFRSFNRRMDRQLAELVGQWCHLAAPNTWRLARPDLVSAKPKPK